MMMMMMMMIAPLVTHAVLPAAGLTLAGMGWAHEGDAGRPGAWDRSALGFDSTWSSDRLLPGAEWPPVVSVSDNKGKNRASSFSLSSMAPIGQLGGGGGNGGGTRTRSGTVVPVPVVPQPPLSVAIDYSGQQQYHASHPPPPPLTIDVSAASSSSFGGGGATTHSRTGSRNGSAFSTPTGSGSRSPAGSIYNGGNGGDEMTPIGGPNGNGGRQGWRRVGGETTEEEVERRAMEEEDRELMG